MSQPPSTLGEGERTSLHYKRLSFAVGEAHGLHRLSTATFFANHSSI
jgi:hypothetical protein